MARAVSEIEQEIRALPDVEKERLSRALLEELDPPTLVPNKPGWTKFSEEATVRKISCVELPSAHHLYWLELDVDLAVASIRNPKAFPLVPKAGT